MKVVAVIPVKGREPLLKYTIRRLYEKNGVYRVICIGDKEKEVCVSEGADFIEFPNNPLGAKWNAGFLKAKNYNPDACLFMGSSDWVSDNWLEETTPFLDKWDIIGKPDFYMLDIQEELRACHWLGYDGSRAGEPIGIGRLISKRILDRLEWKPMDAALDRSMDFSMYHRVLGLGGKVKLVTHDSIKSLSISTGKWENMHKFEDHWRDIVPSKTNRIYLNKLDGFPEYKELHAELYK